MRVVLAEGNALVTVEGDGELSGTLRVAKVRTTWILPVGPSLSCLTGALTGTSVAAGRLDAAESGVKKRTVCVGSYEWGGGGSNELNRNLWVRWCSGWYEARKGPSPKGAGSIISIKFCGWAGLKRGGDI